MEGTLKKVKGRSEKLEALCRMLQDERKGGAAAGGAGAGAGPAPDTPPGKVWGPSERALPACGCARRRRWRPMIAPKSPVGCAGAPATFLLRCAAEPG